MDLSERSDILVGRHPWELARARAIRNIIHAEQHEAGRILDLGCGDGFTGLELFERAGGTDYVGYDTNLTDEQCSGWTRPEESIRFLNRDLPSASFDTILLCDVVEHVEDDVQLLRDTWSRLAPKGVLVVTAPAFQFLFSEHDRALRHYRRYSRRRLLTSIASAELTVRYSGYLFSSLLPARGLAALDERLRRGRSSSARPADIGIGNWSAPAWMTRTLSAVLSADNAALMTTWKRGFGLPGLTTFAVCERER